MKVLASGSPCHHLLASKSALITLVALLTYALMPSVALAYANAASAPGYWSLRVFWTLDNYYSTFSLNFVDYDQTSFSSYVLELAPPRTGRQAPARLRPRWQLMRNILAYPIYVNTAGQRAAAGLTVTLPNVTAANYRINLAHTHTRLRMPACRVSDVASPLGALSAISGAGSSVMFSSRFRVGKRAENPCFA